VQALGVSRELDGCAFGAAGLKLFEGAEAREVEVGPRIGLTKGKELPLRFCVRESSWLSR
jgi:DNA-3-methyladenine glycosylase